MKAALGLGSNLGDRFGWLQQAATRLQALRGCSAWRFSGIYETDPVDCPSPLTFLNAAATLETTLAPQELLAEVQAIETALARERPYRNAPRTIDIDLLLIDELIVDTPTLTLPHPRMLERLFVLAPLAEVAGAWLHPTTGTTIAACCRLRQAPGLVRPWAQSLI